MTSLPSFKFLTSSRDVSCACAVSVAVSVLVSVLVSVAVLAAGASFVVDASDPQPTAILYLAIY